MSLEQREPHNARINAADEPQLRTSLAMTEALNPLALNELFGCP